MATVRDASNNSPYLDGKIELPSSIVDIRKYGAIPYRKDLVSVEDAPDSTLAFQRAATERAPIFIGLPDFIKPGASGRWAYAVSETVSLPQSVFGVGSKQSTITAKPPFSGYSASQQIDSDWVLWDTSSPDSQDGRILQGVSLSVTLDGVECLGPTEAGSGVATAYKRLYDVSCGHSAIGVGYVVNTGGMLGGHWQLLNVQSTGSAGCVRLLGEDAFLSGMRLSTSSNSTAPPITHLNAVGGEGNTGNILCTNTFIAMADGPEVVIRLQGTEIGFDGLFIEGISGGPQPDSLKWIFNSQGGMMLRANRVNLNLPLASLTSLRALVRVRNIGGYCHVNGLRIQSKNRMAAVAVYGVANLRQTVHPTNIHLQGIDSCQEVVIGDTETTGDMSNKEIASFHISGLYQGQTLDHIVSPDGTTTKIQAISKAPSIISKTAIDGVSANARKVYWRAPNDCRVQRARVVASGARATGAATITFGHLVRRDTIAAALSLASGGVAGDFADAVVDYTDDSNVVLRGEVLIGTVGGTNTAGIELDTDIEVGNTYEFPPFPVAGFARLPIDDSDIVDIFDMSDSAGYTLSGTDILTLEDLNDTDSMAAVNGNPVFEAGVIDVTGSPSAEDIAVFTQGGGHIKTSGNITITNGETWFWMGQIDGSLPANDEVLFSFGTNVHVLYDVGTQQLKWVNNQAGSATVLSGSEVEGVNIVIAVTVTDNSDIAVRVNFGAITIIDPHNDITAGGAPFRIGGLADVGTNEFKGDFYEWRRYNRAMTDIEVAIRIRDLRAKWSGILLTG